MSRLPDIWHRDKWDQLLMHPVEDGSGFLMRSTYRVQFGDGETNYFLQVPVDFHTDLASIPPFAKPFFGTWGRHTAAAICHDCMYSYRAGSKELADDLFEALMLRDAVDPHDAQIMATAVRLFGAEAWESDEPHPAVDVLRTNGYWVNAV